MEFLKILIESNQAINNHMGLMIIFSWFTVWIIIFCIMVTISNIIMIIKSIFKNKNDKREYALKEKIANQYINLSTTEGPKDEALRVLEEGCKNLLKESNRPLPIIFGSAEVSNESNNESSIPGTTEESISE